MLWRAEYCDGTDLWESPLVSSAEIDRVRCTKLQLTESGILKVSVEIPPMAKAVYRHRVIQDIGGGSEREAWIAGYSYRSADGPSAVLTYLYPDGTVEVKHDVNDLDFYDYELS